MLSLIVGLNTGTLSRDGLLRVDNANSRELAIIGYIDTTYNPPMPFPIYCLDKSRAQQRWNIFLSPQQMSGPEICFFVTSNMDVLRIFYPFAQKVIHESKYVQRSSSSLLIRMNKLCRCPNDQMSPGCNSNDIVIMVFYDQEFEKRRTLQMAADFQEIVIKRAGLVNPLAEYLANMIRYGWGGGRENPEDDALNTPLETFKSNGKVMNWSWARNKTFNQLIQKEFQIVCEGRCGTMYFLIASKPGESSVNMPINRFDLSLGQLSPNSSLVYNSGTPKNPIFLPVSMCVDTFSQPQALARLSRAPPVKLIQSYYECASSLNAALMSSIGNSFAAARLYVGLSWAGFGVIFVLVMRFRAKRCHAVVLTQHNKAGIEAAESQIRNELIYAELKELREEIAILKASPDYALSRLDSFLPLFLEQRGALGPEDHEALERVGAEISNRLHQAKQPDEKRHGDERMQPDASSTVVKRQSFPRARSDNTSSIGNLQSGREGSRRLSAHPMGYVLSGTQPRTRASLVSSLVVRGGIADLHQI